MIGRRHSGDEIAFEFIRLMKSASKEAPLQKKAEDGKTFKPEDFLVGQVAAPESLGHALDESISSVGNAAKDDVEHSAKDEEKVEIEADKVEIKTKGDVEVEEDDALDHEHSHEVNMSDDIEISAHNKFVLNGLGQVAASLRQKNKHFEADMVEVTARSIIHDLTKEAVKKASAFSALEKVAASFASEGDKHASAVLKEAMGKIKSKK